LSHQHSHAPSSFGLAFGVGIALNTLYVIVELSIGLASGSLGLVADAGHNMSDVLSLVVAWVGAHLALRPPSARFSYGLKRSPILASLFNALLLFAAMGVVAWEAIRRLQAPTAPPGMTVIWVAAVGLLVNFGTAIMFARGRDDLNIRGAYLHMMADGAVTLGVLLSGVVILVTGAPWVDPVISLAIVMVVLWSTWSLFRESLQLSLDAVPKGIDPEAVRDFLCSLPQVKDVHDLHIRALSTTEVALSAHLLLQGQPRRDLLSLAREGLHDEFEIHHVTLQLEPPEAAFDCGFCDAQEPPEAS